jgi:hypothetical protein
MAYASGAGTSTSDQQRRVRAEPIANGGARKHGRQPVASVVGIRAKSAMAGEETTVTITNAAGVKMRPALRGPVRVTMPAAVAFNPDALRKTIAGLAEQIGHPQCFSGADCFLQMEREFIVDPAAKLTASRAMATAEPSPEPWKITVALSRAVRYDLNKIFAAIDKVNGLLGCSPCCSGFDFHFREELEFIAVNDKLETQRFGAQS